MHLLYLSLGGVLGTLARFAIGGWLPAGAAAGFPWGTLAVNLSGSFLLGLAVRAAELAPISPEVRAFVAVGFCGAFTTFSTYMLETAVLMQQGAWVRAGLYSLGSLALGLAALALGIASAGLFLRAAA